MVQVDAEKSGEMPEETTTTFTRAPNFIKSLVRRSAVEFVGVAIFVFIGTMQGFNTGDSILVPAFAHGITIALMIGGFGHISGGHYNPAVTIGVALGGGVGIIDSVAYIVSQLLGGFFGSLLARTCHTGPQFAAMKAGATLINTQIPVGQCLVCEIILTFILVHAVLVSAVDTDSNLLAPLIIGLSVFVDILAGGKVSGASMNPARTFGPALSGTIFGIDGTWDNAWIYFVGPPIGAVIAAGLYRLLWGNENKRFLLK